MIGVSDKILNYATGVQQFTVDDWKIQSELTPRAMFH